MMRDVSDEFAALMVTLAAAYPSAKLTELQVRVYATALSDFPLPQVQTACERAMKESLYMPSVAELRKYLEPQTDDAALLAWTALIQAVPVVGAYASLQVEDPYTAAAVTAIGGWPAVCALDEGPTLAQKRQEFMALYRHSRRTKPRHAGAWTRLAGLCEASGVARASVGWTGRLTAGGEASSIRDTPQLPGAVTVNRLTDGSEP